MKPDHEDLVPVTFRAPRSLLEETDELVRDEDLDRSKFIRSALRDKLMSLKKTRTMAEGMPATA